MQYTYRKGSWTHTHTHTHTHTDTPGGKDADWNLIDGWASGCYTPAGKTRKKTRQEGQSKQSVYDEFLFLSLALFHSKCSFLYMATVIRLIDSCFTTNFSFCPMVVKLTSLTLMSKCYQSFYTDSSVRVRVEV